MVMMMMTMGLEEMVAITLRIISVCDQDDYAGDDKDVMMKVSFDDTGGDNNDGVMVLTW